MTKTLGDYLFLILTIFGSAASILLFGTYFAPGLNEQGLVGVIFLGIIALLLLFYNFYLVLKYRKKIRYANIFEDLNFGFACLHKIDRRDIKSIKAIAEHLGELCTSISDSFTKINGHHIGVCIKFLTYSSKFKNRPKVLTLVRDKKSQIKRKSGIKDKTDHWLDENSDFDFIYANFDDDNIETSYYYKSLLPLRRNYKNTRLKNWPPKTKNIIFNFIERIRKWPLIYKSTLVVPIVPLEANEQEKSVLRGFLCIDSPRNIAFNKNIDIDILKFISDGLYNIIDKLYTLKKDKNEKN